MRLAAIPRGSYSDYRYRAIFEGYKWDPQVGDVNTLARHVLLLTEEEEKELSAAAEGLYRETLALERQIAGDKAAIKNLGLPRAIEKMAVKLPPYDESRGVRLMRFDLHPAENGWAVSEVNSDVPGGFAEASALPQIAAEYFPRCRPGLSMVDILIEGFSEKITPGGTVAFVHATSYSDDRQVMQFASDRFAAAGFPTVFAAPDLIRWRSGKAYLPDTMGEAAIDGMIRFFPLEWLANLPHGSKWRDFFGGSTVSCNPPQAILSQSKRLPLLWDSLAVDLPTWRRLLPETREARDVPRGSEEWIYKPAMGRVGEGISVKGAVPEKERRQIERSARLFHKDWVAQRLFRSAPLKAPDGQDLHLCIGVFAIDGRCAGFYGRVSPLPRIDAGAMDIPILIEKGAEL